MYTRLTRKDVKAGKFDANDYYEEFAAASQILRAIYVQFGWNHMLEGLHHVNETIEDLATSAVKSLNKNDQHSTWCATGGMRVEAAYEDLGENSPDSDVLRIDVMFEII